ncbi:YjzC family protein [Virgibacillus xinjiangensis]|uniref:YjzC family protein n=1 Tax=Virgibacillus xinjiangensis TaxID=393090 RepID=A0ABV7CU35_9BACI
MAEQYKTGQEAPENGTYKVVGLVNENKGNDDTEIKLEKGENFPPSPSTREAAYWKKK